MKHPDVRKKLAVAAALIAVLAILGGAIFSLWAVNSVRVTPSPEVVSLTAAPDFAATIRWRRSAGAEYYVLEYKYAFFPGQTRVVHTSNTYKVIERIKGTLSFRVKAVFRQGETEFSEWKDYEIAPLPLATPAPFSVAKYAGTSGTQVKMVIGSWNPVTYYYRNNDGAVVEDYVNFFEYFVVAPGQDKETMILHPKTVIAVSDFKIRDFGFADSGEWKIYYRATTFDYVINEQGYYAERRIDRMYAPTDDWAEVSINI